MIILAPRLNPHRHSAGFQATGLHLATPHSCSLHSRGPFTLQNQVPGPSLHCSFYQDSCATNSWCLAGHMFGRSCLYLGLQSGSDRLEWLIFRQSMCETFKSKETTYRTVCASPQLSRRMKDLCSPQVIDLGCL